MKCNCNYHVSHTNKSIYEWVYFFFNANGTHVAKYKCSHPLPDL